MSERRKRVKIKQRRMALKRMRADVREAVWMRREILLTMKPEERSAYNRMVRTRSRHYRLRQRDRMDPKTRRAYDRGLALILVTLIAGIIFASWVYIAPVRGMYEPKTKATETNRQPAFYRSEELMRFALSLFFPDLAGKLERSYVIPGMKATKTLQGEFKASAMCTSMTPQGMCVTEDYLVISAYCHIQKHNSVLYLLDKESGELLKTIPLGGKAHVGGLAYDPVHRNVWVSGGTTGAAKAIAYRLKDLEEYDEYSRTPVTAVYNYTLAAMIRNSYMSYAKEALVVGLFKKSGLSSITWYDLTEEGGLKAQIFADYDAVLESVVPDRTAVTSGEVQGVSQTGIESDDPEQGEVTRVLLSKSYGPFDSALQIHTAGAEEAYFRDRDADRIVRFPQKMEQICEADGKIYCLFESAAYAYRSQPALIIDRVLVFDAEEILQK